MYSLWPGGSSVRPAWGGESTGHISVAQIMWTEVVMVGCGGCDSPKKIQMKSTEGGRIDVYAKCTDVQYSYRMGTE